MNFRFAATFLFFALASACGGTETADDSSAEIVTLNTTPSLTAPRAAPSLTIAAMPVPNTCVVTAVSISFATPEGASAALAAFPSIVGKTYKLQTWNSTYYAAWGLGFYVKGRTYGGDCIIDGTYYIPA